ncbi:MAG: DUF6057 family protein [Bacteroidales bacterium]
MGFEIPKETDQNLITVTSLFFASFYFFVVYFTRTELIYFVQQPIFLLDEQFLLDYLKNPGGIIAYISSFLSQFYCYPWLGALIMTVVALITTVVTYRWLILLGIKKINLLLGLLPALILLVLFSDPDYMLSAGLILLTAMLFLNFYLKNDEFKPHAKAITLLFSSIILYFLAGGFSVIFYTVCCLLSELVFRRQLKSVMILLPFMLVSVLIPWLAARLLFYITYEQAYFHLFVTETYYKPPFFLYVLSGYFPAVLLVYGIFNMTAIKGSGIFNLNNKTPKDKKSLDIVLVIQVILIILSVYLIRSYYADSEERLINRIKYEAYEKNWEKVIELAKANPSDDRLINFHTNRALYYMGRLSEDLFKFPQSWGVEALFLGEIVDPYVLMDNSDLYFDLGHISSAKQWAYEAQTIYENSPRVLKQLVLTNIILGNKGAANIILAILEESPVNRGWANYYQSCIEDSSLLRKDELIQEKRKWLPKNDFYTDRKSPDADLVFLIEDHNSNKMAFEYLMAYYLLSNDLMKFADYVKYLPVLGYEKIPEVYEEALVIYLTRKNVKPLGLKGYTLSRQTVSRFEDYARILLAYNKDRNSARRDLFKNHGSSYWYYLHYISPVTTNKKLKLTTKK